MHQTVVDWAGTYINDIARATYPYIHIDVEDVLKQYKKRYGVEVLNRLCKELSSDELSDIGYQLHRLTIEALRTQYNMNHGEPHPGLRRVYE